MITRTEKIDYSSGIPAWEFYDNDKFLGYAVPTLFQKMIPANVSFYTPGRLAVYLSVHPIELTDTRVFDYAVPINEDRTFPFDGEACTVYESNDLETGIVPLFSVRIRAGELTDKAVLGLYE